MRAFVLVISVSLFSVLRMDAGLLSFSGGALAQQTNSENPKGSGDTVNENTGREDLRTFIILPRVGNIRRAPSFPASVAFKLGAGTELFVTAKNEDWYAVRLPDGQSGWAHESILTQLPDEERQSARSSEEIYAIRAETLSQSTTKILFELGGFYPPVTSVIEGEKPRIVCDFPEMRLAAGINIADTFNNHSIQRIRIGFHETPRSKVRVVLDLVEGPDYAVEQHFFEKENYFAVLIKRVETSPQ
jgi:Bacterial SH3 domain